MRHSAITVAPRLAAVAVWAVGLGPAFFAVVLSPRGPADSGAPADWGLPTAQEGPAAWQLQVGMGYLLATVALLVGVLLFALAGPRRPAGPVGAAVAAAALGMYAGPVLSALFGGHGGAGDWRLYLAPLTVAALYAAPRIRPAAMMRRVRAMLRVYTWGSLCALAVAPGWALAASPIVNFRLPGLGSSRLVGVTTHPILLGVIASAALAVELAPLYRSRLWPLHAGAAAAVLVLAQSRTAWLAAPLGLLLLYRRGAHHRIHPLLRRLLVLGIAVCGAVLVPALVTGAGQVLSDREVSTLHGRTAVWDMAMSAFRSDVLLGYGPTLFTDRSSPVQAVYSHAHSQLHQTLATSGLVGAAGLLLFAAAVVVAAARGAAAGAGLPWALTAVTVATCVTEAPLRGVDFSPFLLLVLVLVSVLLAWSPAAGAAGDGPPLRGAAPDRPRHSPAVLRQSTDAPPTPAKLAR
ncbi:O-antigen ligase family protein [Streptomyces sp. NRRL B-24484]|uniref:O-antigen ligase family protein n=1 Tax=Streptomyces sp. NRRL B-24484 TaxID=1463833 RepID=UPI0004C0227A|nr:O-antigen ligase family protein [Streptomyces sp. NRRL B-24484]